MARKGEAIVEVVNKNAKDDDRTAVVPLERLEHLTLRVNSITIFTLLLPLATRAHERANAHISLDLRDGCDCS
eukprot:COSAG05_NODE_946_length_6457_cov_4.475243_8_plen_73_part_00